MEAREKILEEIATLKREREEVLAKVNELSGCLRTLKDKLNAAYKRLNKIKHSTVQVSDHAVLRYLERIKGLDLEAIKKEIMPGGSQRLPKALGNGTYPVHNSHRFRVVDGVVVTVLPYHGQKRAG